MSRIHKLDSLRDLLNATTFPDIEDEGFHKVADAAIRFTKRWNMRSPYDDVPMNCGNGPLIWADKLCPFAQKVWFADATRAYLAEQMAMEDPSEAKPYNVFDDYDSPAFEDVAVNLLSPRFLLCAKGSAELQLYKIEDAALGVVAQVIGSEAQISKVFARELQSVLREQNVVASPKRTKEMAAAFERAAPISAVPALLGQPGEGGYCLHRATVRPDPTMPFPHVQQFLDRLNDPAAFAAWIWGVYSGQNRGRQILYVSDTTGEGGKSSLLNAIRVTLFGEAISTGMNAKALENQFAMASFEGKKFVVAGDCKNRFVVHLGALKELSGDDPSFIDRKFVQPYSTRLEARVVVLSNYEPFLSRDRHNVSRTLWVKLEPLNGVELDPRYGEKCAAEMPGFLAYAEACYAARCPNHYEIRVNDRVAAACSLRTAAGEDDYQTALGEHFVIEADASLTSAEWNRITAKELRLDAHKAEDFRNWLLMQAPLEMVMAGSGRSWHLVGIRLKTPADVTRDARRAHAAATGTAATVTNLFS